MFPEPFPSSPAVLQTINKKMQDTLREVSKETCFSSSLYSVVNRAKPFTGISKNWDDALHLVDAVVERRRERDSLRNLLDIPLTSDNTAI
jgi:hypothetical protein